MKHKALKKTIEYNSRSYIIRKYKFDNQLWELMDSMHVGPNGEILSEIFASLRENINDTYTN